MTEGFDLPAYDPGELFRRYQAQLPDKAALIDALWTRIQAGSGDRDALSLLRLHAHRLAGSAAPHGLPTLGEAARKMDRALAGLAEVPDVPTPESLAALAPLLADLRRALRAPG